MYFELTAVLLAIGGCLSRNNGDISTYDRERERERGGGRGETESHETHHTSTHCQVH